MLESDNIYNMVYRNIVILFLFCKTFEAIIAYTKVCHVDIKMLLHLISYMYYMYLFVAM